MDDRFLTPSRLSILQAVAKGTATASSIAKETNISLPYVLNQLQLLAAKNFIQEKKGKQEKKPGKPATRYVLANNFATVLLAKEGFCEKITFSHAPPSMLLYLQISSFVAQHLTIFSKHYWQKEAVFAKLHALAHIQSSEEKVEVLAICEHEALDTIRKQISHSKYDDETGKKIEFVTWAHSMQEIEEGLARNDTYYLNLMQRMNIIFDKNEQLKKVKIR